MAQEGRKEGRKEGTSKRTKRTREPSPRKEPSREEGREGPAMDPEPPKDGPQEGPSRKRRRRNVPDSNQGPLHAQPRGREEPSSQDRQEEERERTGLFPLFYPRPRRRLAPNSVRTRWTRTGRQ